MYRRSKFTFNLWWRRSPCSFWRITSPFCAAAMSIGRGTSPRASLWSSADLELEQSALERAVVELDFLRRRQADVPGQVEVSRHDKDLPPRVAGLEDFAHFFVQRLNFGFFAKPGAIRRIGDQKPRPRRRGLHRAEVPYAEFDELFDAGPLSIVLRRFDSLVVAIGGDNLIRRGGQSRLPG